MRLQLCFRRSCWLSWRLQNPISRSTAIMASVWSSEHGGWEKKKQKNSTVLKGYHIVNHSLSCPNYIVCIDREAGYCTLVGASSATASATLQKDSPLHVKHCEWEFDTVNQTKVLSIFLSTSHPIPLSSRDLFTPTSTFRAAHPLYSEQFHGPIYIPWIRYPISFCQKLMGSCNILHALNCFTAKPGLLQVGGSPSSLKANWQCWGSI